MFENPAAFKIDHSLWVGGSIPHGACDWFTAIIWLWLKQGFLKVSKTPMILLSSEKKKKYIFPKNPPKWLPPVGVCYYISKKLDFALCQRTWWRRRLRGGTHLMTNSRDKDGQIRKQEHLLLAIFGVFFVWSFVMRWRWSLYMSLFKGMESCVCGCFWILNKGLEYRHMSFADALIQCWQFELRSPSYLTQGIRTPAEKKQKTVR